MSMSAAGEGLHCNVVNELARRPPKPPSGGQAVTAQLIVVSIWAAGKGRSSVHASRKSH